MLNKKIRIAKTIEVNGTTQKDEFLELIYNVILRELKTKMQDTYGIVKSTWPSLRYEKHSFYNVSSSMIYSLVIEYNRVEKYKVFIESRTGLLIPLKFKAIEIINFDWKENLEFKLTFESEELYFLGFAGNIVWITPTTDGLNTHMIDLDDKSISVSHLVTEPFKN